MSSLRASFRKGEEFAQIHSIGDAIIRGLQVGVPALIAMMLPIAWYWRVLVFYIVFKIVGISAVLLKLRRENLHHQEGVIALEPEITPLAFKHLYLNMQGSNFGPEAHEVVNFLVRAGIGARKYIQPPRPTRPIFWRKGAVAANQLRAWMRENPTATVEACVARARYVVDINRLIQRSLRMS